MNFQYIFSELWKVTIFCGNSYSLLPIFEYFFSMNSLCMTNMDFYSWYWLGPINSAGIDIILPLTLDAVLFWTYFRFRSEQHKKWVLEEKARGRALYFMSSFLHIKKGRRWRRDEILGEKEVDRVETKIPIPFYAKKAKFCLGCRSYPIVGFWRFRFSRNSCQHFHFLENFRVHHPTLSLFEKIIPVCANTCPANFC